MQLVDTDVMVDVLRRYPPAMAWLASIEDEEVVLPGFVLMELIQGCRNRREQRALERQLLPYGVVWPSPETCDAAASVFSQYCLSHGLGIIDALIGRLALAMDLALNTFNQRHYAPIPGLRTVQPYEKTAP